jgi:type IV secretory pathway TraG/TraD family ATPase VirD4
MIERALMTPDELKSLPKGTFIVTKTGFYPMKVKLKLFFKWGIQFDEEPYKVEVKDSSQIQYADRDSLLTAIRKKYPPVEEKRMGERMENKKEDDEEGESGVSSSSEITKNSIYMGHQKRTDNEGKSHPNKIVT